MNRSKQALNGIDRLYGRSVWYGVFFLALGVWFLLMGEMAVGGFWILAGLVYMPIATAQSPEERKCPLCGNTWKGE